MENEILQEKYRPKTFEEFIGIENHQQIVDFCNEPFKLPHFLFIGKHGSGKTTLAKIIIRKLNAEYLLLNASDESGIDTIRGKVKTFAKTLSKNPEVPKIIFLDEADYLGGGSSKTAQAALRGIIETYSKTCRFILTCNYQLKIIPELHSRLTTVEFGDYKKDDILKYLINICKKESIIYEEEALTRLIDLNYPDIRAMVKILSFNKEITTKTLKEKNVMFNYLFELVKDRKLIDARKYWNEKNLDLKEVLYFFFEKVLNTDYSVQQKKEIINHMALTDFRFSVGVTDDIQFFNFCVGVKL